jgi:hypothetical protein
MFCEGLQHRLRFYLDHLNCVKIAAFQFYLQSGKQRKVGWEGDDNHVVFGLKFIASCGRKCETVCCRDATASLFVAKFRDEMFAHFHAVAIKRHSSMLNWLFSLSGRIICERFLHVKGNDERALDFALHISHFSFRHVLNRSRHSNTHLRSMRSSRTFV